MGICVALFAGDDGFCFCFLYFDFHGGGLVLEEAVEGVVVAGADEIFVCAFEAASRSLVALQMAC